MLAECSNWWNNYIWDILLANIGEHIPAPWSIWVKITFKIHRNLKEAMKTRVKWWDGIEHGSIAMTTGYNGEIIVNMWGFTSKIWPILDIPLNCFTSSDPHPDTLFWRSFWHTIWTYVLVCIYIYILYIYKFWHSFWHILWHWIWHYFWHSLWHVFGSRRGRQPEGSWRYDVGVQAKPTGSEGVRRELHLCWNLETLTG